MDDYQFIKNLSKGSFGEVKCYENIKTKEKVAIKFVPKDRCTLIQNELVNHDVVSQHPNIINIYNMFIHENDICIVLEYAEHGDLLAVMNKGCKILTEDMIKYFMKNLLLAVDHCHLNNVVHCDIKLENILINKCGDVKLCDFGYSQNINVYSKSRIGTLQYIAPEILLQNIKDYRKVDIYACGVSMYILLHVKYPFHAATPQDIMKNILLNKYDILRTDVSESCLDIMERMLKRDPCERISMIELLNHPWFD